MPDFKNMIIFSGEKIVTEPKRCKLIEITTHVMLFQKENSIAEWRSHGIISVCEQKFQRSQLANRSVSSQCLLSKQLMVRESSMPCSRQRRCDDRLSSKFTVTCRIEHRQQDNEDSEKFYMRKVWKNHYFAWKKILEK